MVRDLALRALDHPLFARAVGMLERAERDSPHLLRVLTYHRVDDVDAQPALSPVLRSASPADFEMQMRFLRARYRIIPMERLLAYYEAGEALPPRALLVTFDDAYRDFAEHAWPILRSLALPATLFVPTAFPDQPARTFWWDRLWGALVGAAEGTPIPLATGQRPLERATLPDIFKQLREQIKAMPHEQAMARVDALCTLLDAPAPVHQVLGWDALRRLAAEGVTLGAHTRHHPLLTSLSPEAAVAEALVSREDLEREVGPTLPIFAYPSGGVSPAVVWGLAGAGFRIAFSTARGVNDLRRAQPLRLHRVNVGGRTTLPLLRAQLLAGWGGLHR